MLERFFDSIKLREGALSGCVESQVYAKMEKWVIREMGHTNLNFTLYKTFHNKNHIAKLLLLHKI